MLVAFGHVKNGARSFGVQPLMAVRYPEVWIRFFQVDVGFLPNAVCGVYKGQNAPLTADGDHFFPRRIHAGIGDDAVNDCNNLQLCAVTQFALLRLYLET